MDTAAFLAFAIIAVSVTGMIATVVPRIREEREERARAREIDKLHQSGP